MVRCGVVRFGVVLCKVVWSGMVKCGLMLCEVV